jgi:FkbM family methyltransferase
MNAALRALCLAAIRIGVRLPARAVGAFFEHSSLKDIIDELGINCVIDVGANRGQFATSLRRIGFRGTIFSFEPVKKDFDVLAARFAGDRNWRGFQIALGATAGTAYINAIPSLSVMSSLLMPLQTDRTIEKEAVQIDRLDTILSDHFRSISSPRVLLKMDTQGYDVECFKGATNVLQNVFAIFSELSVKGIYAGAPHYLDALAIYEACEFDLIGITAVSFRDGAIQELNCLMRRRRY